jgi:hypothetical protein
VAARPVLSRVPQGLLIDAARVSPSFPDVVVLFTDNEWRGGTILAWCRHRRAWVALIRWPNGNEDWWEHDARFLRPNVEPCGGWADR